MSLFIDFSPSFIPSSDYATLLTTRQMQPILTVNLQEFFENATF
jgi:hypothetical protein